MVEVGAVEMDLVEVEEAEDLDVVEEVEGLDVAMGRGPPSVVVTLEEGDTMIDPSTATLLRNT